MKTMETDLNSTETQAREAPETGREHTDSSQRARTRGEHAASTSTSTPRRQSRRRAAHRQTTEAHRTNVETGYLSENSLDLFLRAARAHSLLTAEEEIELAKRIERGDLEAKERMINANLRLVVSQARRYQGHGLPMEDLVQEGMLGLDRKSTRLNSSHI